MQAQKVIDEFSKRDTAVIAISNEDTSEEDFLKIFKDLGRAPSIKVGGDIGYRHRAFDRTHIYYVDKQGVVQQVFPMEIYRRAPWWAILNEIDRLQSDADTQKTP